ncbi:MAG: thioredoxin family protein [Alphaproteobacteria bacterium]
MAVTPSNDIELGTPAPGFALPDATGKTHRLEDFSDKPALLVAFWCNHCPFVKHIRRAFAAFAREYAEKRLAVVAINSNDEMAYPEDSLVRMGEEVKARGFIFPYVQDKSQDVAKAFGAACTPDFFLFDAQRTLFYHGQFDASRPGNNVPVTGADLRSAVDRLLAGQSAPAQQTPSIGCNIKWRHGSGTASRG